MISIESSISQRKISSRLGMALGVTNKYIKSFIKQGLLKIEHTPANEYLYHLTSKGVMKRNRLASTYIISAFEAFRKAKHECLEFYCHCDDALVSRIGIFGQGDLVDIAKLLARDYEFDLLDMQAMDVISCENIDYYMVADLNNAQIIYDELISRVDQTKIFCFSILDVNNYQGESY